MKDIRNYTVRLRDEEPLRVTAESAAKILQSKLKRQVLKIDGAFFDHTSFISVKRDGFLKECETLMKKGVISDRLHDVATLKSEWFKYDSHLDIESFMEK